MRILQLIDSLAGGGAETSLAEIAPALVGQGVELHVGFFADRRDVAERLVSAGAQIWPLIEATSRTKRVRSSRNLIGRIRPDLVHTTLFEADIAGRTAARLSRRLVVSSLVNEMYGPAQIAAGVPLTKLRAAQAADIITSRFVTRFHAISDTVAETMSLRLRIPLDKVEVIHRGRDAGQMGTYSSERRISTRSALGIGPQTKLVLAVGRQEQQKGFDGLLNATSGLLAGGRQIKVLIAGREGGATHALRAQIEALRLGDAVTLLGRREDVADLMVAADVLAFTSLWEGFGGTVVEALAVMCPIVCSDLPVLKEVLGTSASYFPTGNDIELEQALGLALDSGRNIPRLEAGRQLFLDRYTTEVCAARTIGFYQRALSAGG